MNTTLSYPAPAVAPCYLSVSQRTDRLPRRSHFEIQKLGWLLKNDQMRGDKLEQLSQYEVNWFKSGAGSFVIDSTIHSIKNNSIYCVVPGQFRTCQLSDNVEGYRLSFSPDFLYIGSQHSPAIRWLDSYGSGRWVPMMHADAELQSEMELLVSKMEKEFSNFYLLRSELLSGLLNILLIHFSRNLKGRNNDFIISKDNDLVCRFRILLKEQFVTKKLVADYARELNVTPNYLNRSVKKITGQTARHLIQQHIILEAKRKAIHSNISMKEVAYYLGFDSLAHFSKFFKNNSGMNFSSFRNSARV